MKLICWLKSDAAQCWNISGEQVLRLKYELPGWNIAAVEDENALLRELSDADAAAAWMFRQAWFDSAPKLRLLKTPAAGLDYFQVDPPPGVRFERSYFHGLFMAETAIGWLLSHSRGICRSAVHMKHPGWPRRSLADGMRTLKGSRLTIIGFGSIGRETGRIASLLGCSITGVRRKQTEPENLPEWFGPDDRVAAAEGISKEALFRKILPESDHLLLVLPGGRDTDNLIGSGELALLPSHAGIYNLGRGNAIDQAALAVHLEKHEKSEAFLDVFENEPLPETSPLRNLPNAFLMPHISAAAPGYLDSFLDELIPACRKLQTRNTGSGKAY
jgi:phosphoglycerate dehydrogenase-like enzyme